MNTKVFFNKLLIGGGIVFDLAKWIIFALVILILINKFWFSVFIVDGASMEPNLHDKEFVLFGRLNSWSEDPKRGNVVVLNYPGDPENKRYVKRVIALPGETIEINNNQVFVNGKVADEKFLPYGTLTQPNMKYKLNDKEFFLMGDNRENSNDCRVFGPVEKRFLTGIAKTILFPRFTDIR